MKKQTTAPTGTRNRSGANGSREATSTISHARTTRKLLFRTTPQSRFRVARPTGLTERATVVYLRCVSAEDITTHIAQTARTRQTPCASLRKPRPPPQRRSRPSRSSRRRSASTRTSTTRGASPSRLARSTREYKRENDVRVRSR